VFLLWGGNQMNFGQALEALKEGKRVKRAHWGGYWFFAKNPKAKQENPDGYHTSFGFINGLIVAVLKDGGGCAPATPYQEDLLAEDWSIVK
jgi:hypothetical protein